MNLSKVLNISGQTDYELICIRLWWKKYTSLSFRVYPFPSNTKETVPGDHKSFLYIPLDQEIPSTPDTSPDMPWKQINIELCVLK